MELAKQLEIYVRTAQKSASIESKDQYKLTRGAFKTIRLLDYPKKWKALKKKVASKLTLLKTLINYFIATTR